jgi:hypothetical protein
MCGVVGLRSYAGNSRERCASMTENSAFFNARHGAGSFRPHRQPAPTAQDCLKRGNGANWRTTQQLSGECRFHRASNKNLAGRKASRGAPKLVACRIDRAPAPPGQCRENLSTTSHPSAPPVQRERLVLLFRGAAMPEGPMGAVEHLKTLCCLGLPPESAMIAVTPLLHEIIPHGWTATHFSILTSP